MFPVLWMDGLGEPPSWKLPSPLLLVPPSIENEDLEEVIKVPEGQTAQLVCNATGEGYHTVIPCPDTLPCSSLSSVTFQKLPRGLSVWFHYARTSLPLH